MPPASPTRQPEQLQPWFDSASGAAFLEAELGLMMPLLLRRPGLRMCWVLPTRSAARKAPPMLMPSETRLWRTDDGWQSEHGPASDLPRQEMDLVIAAHVLGSRADASAQLDAIHAMLRPGRTAFLLELNPWSPFRWHWRRGTLPAPTMWQLRTLVAASGLTVESSYALNPSTAGDSVGTLLRHDWRTPSWLPHRAYVIRAQRQEAGVTPLGAGIPSGMALGSPGA